ncbi:hypothetical protein [Arenicella xantha]|uniref:Vitamin K epoxide reductase family protein n=1 Tax=Arenicella xantha TaxID=644221 RepID=A0A395JGN8_9GAMM|nr:hypothetical protein [Arenicella xantha]RBP44832.1 hypothetical protein DFR28_1222 [Arenicella xantha]
MNLYNKKTLAVFLALSFITVGILVSYLGYINYLNPGEVHCGVTKSSGASCGTKFGFVMTVVFVIEALGLNYIWSKFQGY